MLVPNPVFHPAGCVNYFIYRQNQTQDSTRINRLKPEDFIKIKIFSFIYNLNKNPH